MLANINSDDDRCTVLTGFNCDQFLQLFEVCEAAMPVTLGRGRRSKIEKHDRLLLALCYLKHYETKEKIKETFLISKSQVQRNLASTIEAITPVLYRRYVETIHELIDPDQDMADFPEARYVMDTTIQEIWTPIGTFEERKRYYSGKHKLYGFKTQTLHNRRGFLLHCVSGIPGAMHDLTIVRQHFEQIQPFLVQQRAVLVDSGYKGLDRFTRAIVPHKKPPGGDLTRDQRTFNRQLASQRVICERWYARLKTRHRIMSSKFRNDRDHYGVFFRLCAALTNFTLITNPL